MPTIFKEADNSDIEHEKATFGMGCFWACDALFGALHGVLSTLVGYSGGTMLNPTYINIGDHTEVVEICFDPTLISYEQLLDLFWKNHEYGVTSKVKTQYMSLILYHNESQKKLAEQSVLKESLKYELELTTVIKPASIFYPAEDYHQKYRLQRHKSLLNAINFKPEISYRSCLAAKLNGYVAGVGTLEQFELDAVQFNLSEKVADYVRRELKNNYGGSLYC